MSKLESNRRRMEEVKEKHAEAISEGEKDVQEVHNIDSILEGVPKNIDENLLSCVERVSDSAHAEGVADMNSEVQGILDEGSREGEEVISESNEQKENSERAKEGFDQVSESEFGKSGAEAAGEAADTAAQFEEISEDTDESIRDAEENFQSLLSEIEG